MLSDMRGLRVAVTGGTGFVGRHLVRTLLDAGADVTCLARTHERAHTLPTGVRPVIADLGTGQGLDALVRGQDACIHLAAVLFGLGWQDYLRGNITATDTLGRALREAGASVQRVVMVSSLAATGPCATAPGVPDIPSMPNTSDTSNIPDTPHTLDIKGNSRTVPVSAYGWSKLLAERSLAYYMGERMVTLRPPIIYGPGDLGLLPYFKAAKWGLVVTPGWPAQKRHFPVSIIHVQDCVQAIVRCLLPQAHGVYHCNDGAQHTMRDIGCAIATAFGRTARTIAMPLPIMGAAATLSSVVGQALARIGRRPPSLTVDKYREAKQAGWLCEGERIRTELGFMPEVGLDQGVREAVAGYKELGLL